MRIMHALAAQTQDAAAMVRTSFEWVETGGRKWAAAAVAA